MKTPIFKMLPLLLVLISTSAEARFLIFGPKVGPGSELRDYHRGLLVQAPTSEWNLSASSKLITLTHTKYYDAYISLQESISNSKSLEKVFETRKQRVRELYNKQTFIIEREDLQVAGVPALSFTYHDFDKGKLIQEIVFIHNRVGYNMNVSVNMKNFEKLQPELEFVIENLQAIPIKKKSVLRSTASAETSPDEAGSNALHAIGM